MFLKEYGGFTEIQKLAMPIVSDGRNCLIVAPTGAGKTEAAVVPLLDRIVRDGKGIGVSLIYITPLRALNRDMLKRLEGMCSNLGVTVGVRHGDTTQSERARQLKRAPAVLITTPETFQNLLVTKSFENALKNVSAVVVDEVHELYGSKRGAQLCLGLERLEWFSKGFQRIGISATLGNPELVRDFLSWGRHCEIAALGKSKRMEVSIDFPDRFDRRIEAAVEKFGLDNEAAARLSRIADYIGGSKSTLIFANTRQMVESVGSRMLFINGIAPFGGIGVHHSSLNKEERIAIEDSFKRGDLRSVIATSSLELGIDIGNIDFVVHYGSPRQVVRMVQRLGRSGHSEKRESKGAIIATNIVEVIESAAIYANFERGRIESSRTHDNALDVLMHQLCGMLLERGRTRKEELYNAAKSAYIYRNIDMGDFSRLMDFMKGQFLINFDEVYAEAMARTRLFYYEHVSFIPDSKRYVVKDFYTNRIISSLDEKFVMDYVEEGAVFITKGLPWKTVSVEENNIIVEPSSDFEAAVPDWSGEDIPVSYDVVQEAYGMLSGSEPTGRLSDEVREKVKGFIEQQKKRLSLDPDSIVIEDSAESKLIYSPLGTLANDALSKALTHMLTARLGRAVLVRSSPYLIFVDMEEDVDIAAMIASMETGTLKELISSSISGTDLFRYRFITIAKFFGVIERDATISKSIARRLIAVMKGSPVYEETMRELIHNYFDLDALGSFLKKLNGAKAIKRVRSERISPLGEVVLNSSYYTKELVMPLTPNGVIVDSFIDYAMRKKAAMVCTYCGFKFSRKLSDIKEGAIQCPNCRSKMISNYSPDYEKIIKMRKEEKRLKRGEKEIFREMMREASLFEAYGGRAAVALATYGIGVTSAARILMMHKHNYKDFFIDLIEAQKQFIRTKKYWSV